MMHSRYFNLVVISSKRNLRINIKRTIDNLAKHKIQAEVVLSSEQLKTKLDTLIAGRGKAGVGDSMTLDKLGIYNYFRDKKINFL